MRPTLRTFGPALNERSWSFDDGGFETVTTTTLGGTIILGTFPFLVSQGHVHPNIRLVTAGIRHVKSTQPSP